MRMMSNYDEDDEDNEDDEDEGFPFALNHLKTPTVDLRSLRVVCVLKNGCKCSTAKSTSGFISGCILGKCHELIPEVPASKKGPSYPLQSARLGLKFHFIRNQEMGRSGGCRPPTK